MTLINTSSFLNKALLSQSRNPARQKHTTTPIQLFFPKAIAISFFVLFSLLFPNCLNARTALYLGDDYEIVLNYNDSVQPGDVILIRMKFSLPENNPDSTGKTSTTGSSVSQAAKQVISAQLEFSNSITGKTEQNANFYMIDKTKNILQAAVPLSTYEQPGDYAIAITYTAFGSKNMRFLLPVSVIKKEFESEFIPLNASNTAIKTNTSTERTTQIDRLNEILGTVDSDAIYQISAFTSPVTSTRRTANFGDRRIYVYVNGKTETSLHYGTDYGVPEGTPVFSCGAGKVVLTENRISTGYSVVIEHMPGLYSLYYHLSSYSVKLGDIVEQGTQIGLSGSTGLATGPHLHWEMRWFSTAVNPDFFTDNSIFTKELIIQPR